MVEPWKCKAPTSQQKEGQQFMGNDLQAKRNRKASLFLLSRMLRHCTVCRTLEFQAPLYFFSARYGSCSYGSQLLDGDKWPMWIIIYNLYFMLLLWLPFDLLAAIVFLVVPDYILVLFLLWYFGLIHFRA